RAVAGRCGHRHPRRVGDDRFRAAPGRAHDADFGPAHVRRIFSHALVAPRTGNPDSVQRMTNAQTDVSMPGLTPMQWAICITAAIGFAFDSYVLLMLPLIVRPALVELLKVPQTDPSIN